LGQSIPPQDLLNQQISCVPGVVLYKYGGMGTWLQASQLRIYSTNRSPFVLGVVLGKYGGMGSWLQASQLRICWTNISRLYLGQSLVSMVGWVLGSKHPNSGSAGPTYLLCTWVLLGKHYGMGSWLQASQLRIYWTKRSPLYLGWYFVSMVEWVLGSKHPNSGPTRPTDRSPL